MDLKILEEFIHYSVMLEEAVLSLNCRDGLIYIDGTLGGGGHSLEIAKRILPNGKLISFDVDPDAIIAAEKKLADYKNVVQIVKSNFLNFKEVLRDFNIEKITGGILLDLGTSYHQLTTAEKGFSFLREAPLDMRLDPNAEKTAYDVVNTYSEEELIKIFKEYGEERFSKKIAGSIIEKRKTNTIKTTVELAEIVKRTVPSSKQKIHPATRVFQAIRIAVNNELANLENTLNEVIPLLEKDARIAVISFHSLEDRIVKNIFRKFSSDCICPPEQMICSCPPRQLELITRKPLLPSNKEIAENPPSRSAKLRVAKKI